MHQIFVSLRNKEPMALYTIVQVAVKTGLHQPSLLEHHGDGVETETSPSPKSEAMWADKSYVGGSHNSKKPIYNHLVNTQRRLISKILADIKSMNAHCENGVLVYKLQTFSCVLV